MSYSPITLDALQALDAIDRRGSFAKAGEELEKATSALSYTVQKLEEQLGLESTTEREPFFQALGTLLEEQPNLEIDLQECVLNGGWEALETDSIDLLMGATSPVPLQKGFRALPIHPADMLLVAAANHPLGPVADDALW